jgi:2-haloalkanoic acid dehalogenase type II
MTMPQSKLRAVLFDFMGTCLDWHSGALTTLPQSIPESTRSSLALQWRQAYFDINADRLSANLPIQDFDITLADALSKTLDEKYPQYKELFGHDDVRKCVAKWHAMPAWPDVKAAIEGLKAAGYEVFVFANGTTRLQLDLCASSGLSFNMLFSSQLLGSLKPGPDSYARVLELIKYGAEEVVQVAAHIEDLRGAVRAGMKTIYVDRWTDDITVEKEKVRKAKEVDVWLDDGMAKLVETVKGLDLDVP